MNSQNSDESLNKTNIELLEILIFSYRERKKSLLDDMTCFFLLLQLNAFILCIGIFVHHLVHLVHLLMDPRLGTIGLGLLKQ